MGKIVRRRCFGKDGREVIVIEMGMSPPLIFFFQSNFLLYERYVLAELVDLLQWGRYFGAVGWVVRYFVWVLGVMGGMGLKDIVLISASGD